MKKNKLKRRWLENKSLNKIYQLASAVVILIVFSTIQLSAESYVSKKGNEVKLPEKKWFNPIPQSEIDKNPELIQNPGY